MATSHSYYDVLGVDPTADHETIRRAFKEKVLTAHPDHGGAEDAFRRLQTAYEVLADWRKRRIYDRYGEDGLDLSSEALFTSTFRGGAFGPEDRQQLVDELQTLRASNEALQRQLMIVRPDTTSKYASSFESWLRNRNPEDLRVVTSETLAQELGVVEGSYEPFPLPPLRSERIELGDLGELASVASRRTVSLPSRLGWNEVLVRWLICPVGAIDHHLARWGMLPGEEIPGPPFVGGTDGIGLVVCAGPGAEGARQGDLVVPIRPALGTWQTLGVHHARDLRAVPPVALELSQLANLMTYAAAYRLLEAFGSIRPGDTIVQSASDGPVGQAVIQLCDLLGLTSINLIQDREGFDEVDDMLRALGANHVWRDRGSLIDRIKRTGAAMPRLGFDAVGGSSLHRIADSLRPGGTLVSYGSAQPRVDPFPFVPLLHRGVELRGFWLYGWLKESRDNFERIVDHVLPLMEQGKLSVRQPLHDTGEGLIAALMAPTAALELGVLEDAQALLKELAAAAN